MLFFAGIISLKSCTNRLPPLVNLFEIGLQSKSDAELPDLNFENIFLINFDRLFLRVSIVWWLFCTTPLWMMLANCTQFSRYLGF
jgi:hypothetical protein